MELFNEYGVLVWEAGKSLEINSDESCTTMQMDFMYRTVHLRIIKMVNFIYFFTMVIKKYHMY